MSESILIITYPDVGIGYKLAGAEVSEAQNGIEATSLLKKALKDTSIGLIGIDEGLYNEINPKLLESVKKRIKPLVLSIESMKDFDIKSTSVEDYIKKLTLSTAGVIVNVEKDK